MPASVLRLLGRVVGGLLLGSLVWAQPTRTAEEENFAALLDSKRLAGAPAPLREAVLRLLFESEHFAFTQISLTGRARDGSDAVETIESYDPSQPPESQWTLVQFRGATPTAANLTEWTQRRRLAATGALSFEDFLDVVHAEPAVPEDGELHYLVPLGRALNKIVPREVMARVTVSRERPTVTRLQMVSRVAAKKTAEQILHLRPAMLFVNQNAAPPPALLHVLGTPGVLWESREGMREVKWTDCRRVKLYDERFGVKIGALKAIDF